MQMQAPFEHLAISDSPIVSNWETTTTEEQQITTQTTNTRGGCSLFFAVETPSQKWSLICIGLIFICQTITNRFFNRLFKHTHLGYNDFTQQIASDLFGFFVFFSKIK